MHHCIVFGQAKLCKYNGQHYCFDCHHDDERIIPSRVLFNWDFRKHKVCIASSAFLDSVEHTPVLDVNSINKALYVYIPELEEARVSGNLDLACILSFFLLKSSLCMYCVIVMYVVSSLAITDQCLFVCLFICI